MIIGIAADDWKVPTFKKYLDQEGYLYTEHVAMKGVVMLKVSCSDPSKLSLLVMDAERECARNKCPSCED